MKSVILGSQLGPLRRILDNHPGPIAYIQLTTTQDGFHIRDYLRQVPNARELPARELFRERRSSFRKKYIQLFGQLNNNNQCLEWWGTPITDRVSTAPDLCRDVAYFTLIAELVRTHQETLVVISDSVDLAAQVQVWAGKEGVAAVNLIKAPWSWRTFLRNHSPAGIVLAFFKMTFGRWIFSRRYWPPPNIREEHVVIASHSHIRSFTEFGEYRDAYFGPLVDNLAESGQKALILAGAQDQPRRQLKMLKTVLSPIPIVPIESCLTPWSLLAALFRALSWYAKFRRVRGSAEIRGLDVSLLVNRKVGDERHSGNLFMNLCVYYAVRSLAATVPVKHWIYPFENLAWEKMMLLGAGDSSKSAVTTGYQHASLTMSNVTYQSILLPERQDQPMPLPARLLTTGEVTKQLLKTEGNYPAGTAIRAACALRASFPPTIETKPRGQRLKNILVAMATNLEEYVGIFVFLEQAFSGVSGFEIRIRPHPVIPVEPAMKTSPLSHPDFYVGNNSPLKDDLQWADVLLYASSTVGLEAVSMGIPVICLDLGHFLEEDPMLGWNGFSWSVQEPSELVDAIKHIQAVPDPEFRELQKKGQEYVTAYLEPVTAAGLRTFYEG